MPSVKYTDQWGDIIDREEGIVEIRWFDSTLSMTGREFNAFLGAFATAVEETRRRLCLVDAKSFLMDPSKFEIGWRDAHIIPRYNEAGVQKFAFIMPDGMPAIGAPPTPEGPANFPTAYFGTRIDAVGWLNS